MVLPFCRRANFILKESILFQNRDSAGYPELQEMDPSMYRGLPWYLLKLWLVLRQIIAHLDFGVSRERYFMVWRKSWVHKQADQPPGKSVWTSVKWQAGCRKTFDTGLWMLRISWQAFTNETKLPCVNDAANLECNFTSLAPSPVARVSLWNRAWKQCRRLREAKLPRDARVHATVQRPCNPRWSGISKVSLCMQQHIWSIGQNAWQWGGDELPVSSTSV